MTVWKYEFEINDELQRKPMPRGAHIIHVAPLDGLICVWALVEERAHTDIRRFRVVGTGHPINLQKECHVGTCVMTPFVWHLFEERP